MCWPAADCASSPGRGAARHREHGRAAAFGACSHGLAAGDILLLHDGSSARDGAGRAVALGALDQVLDGLSAAGLRSVTLDGVSANSAR